MSTESTQGIAHTLIEERAARWLAQRDSGNWSAQHEQDFAAWLNASMAHSVAYWRLQDAWEGASRLRALGAGIQSEDPPLPGEWNLSPFFSSTRDGQRAAGINRMQRAWGSHWRALAAGLSVTVIAAVTWYAWPSGKSFETPVGAVALLPIEDGSKITLNTDSKIKVAMTETERRIELRSGEAFFEVAKDPARPFIVDVGDKRIVALGTSFSVRKGTNKGSGNIQANEIKIIVTDGVVGIETLNGKSAQEGTEERLSAGDIAKTTDSKLVIQRKRLREAQEELSWRSGVLIFRDVTLAHAAAEFNRYNTRKIVIEDASVAALTIAGSFRTTNVESFVEIIEKGYPVRVEAKGGDFLVGAEP